MKSPSKIVSLLKFFYHFYLQIKRWNTSILQTKRQFDVDKNGTLREKTTKWWNSGDVIAEFSAGFFHVLSRYFIEIWKKNPKNIVQSLSGIKWVLQLEAL